MGASMESTKRFRERIKQASISIRPWSTESIAIRNRNQAEMLRGYVHDGQSVLDIGCGTAYLTECIGEMYGAEVTGVDVQDIRAVQVPFRLFDGTSLPFADQSFDHVILSFTLHHCHTPQDLIEECFRVARSTVMAFEDLPEGPVGRMLVALHVEAFRLQYRLKERGGDYRSALQWLSEKAVRMDSKPLPYEWFDRLYVPRSLLIYVLADE